MIESLKKNKFLRLFKDNIMVRIIRQSAGDWRFPFMLIDWKMAAFLTRRRKAQCAGMVFSLPCNNWITHFRWYLFNTKESEVRRYIDENLKDGDIFFDVGANIGVFSLYAAKKFNNVTVYSFEPEYSNLNLLKENIYYNGLSAKIKPYSVGISDFTGLSELHLQDLAPAAAASTESNKPITTTDEGYKVVFSEGIATATIDYLCEQLKVIPSAIKIDTDGNEVKVLRGAKKTLMNSILRSIVIEMPDEGEKGKLCQQMLKDAGLKLFWQDAAKTRNEIWKK